MLTSHSINVTRMICKRVFGWMHVDTYLISISDRYPESAILSSPSVMSFR